MHYILDVDTGIDDALSLLYMLDKTKDSDNTILGITCVFGNVDVEQAGNNTTWLLHEWNHLEIPVFYGASHSLGKRVYKQGFGGNRFHGKNGVADIAYTSVFTMKQKKTACDFLIEAAQLFGDDVCIIASGPLTNIAQAILKAPSAMKTIHQLIFMGGAYHVAGNITPYAEANIYQDPLAASIVLQSEVSSTMIGLDVTMSVLLHREIIETWNYNTQSSNYLYELCDYYMSAYEAVSPTLLGFALHDPLTAAVALFPDLVRTKAIPLNVILKGEQVGRIIQDDHSMSTTKKKTRVAVGVHAQQFLNDFIQSMNRMSNKSGSRGSNI